MEYALQFGRGLDTTLPWETLRRHVCCERRHIKSRERSSGRSQTALRTRLPAKTHTENSRPHLHLKVVLMEIPELSGAETVEFLKSHPEAKLLDVRTDEEYATARIKGATLINSPAKAEAILALPKETPLVFFTAITGCGACRQQSGSSKRDLVTSITSPVAYLDAWSRESRPFCTNLLELSMSTSPRFPKLIEGVHVRSRAGLHHVRRYALPEHRQSIRVELDRHLPLRFLTLCYCLQTILL